MLRAGESLIYDRRSPKILQDWHANRGLFVTRKLNLPGGLEWELAMPANTGFKRNGAFELTFLALVGALIIITSFASIIVLGRKLGSVRTSLEDISSGIETSTKIIQHDSTELSEEATTASGAIEQMSAAMTQFEKTLLNTT